MGVPKTVVPIKISTKRSIKTAIVTTTAITNYSPYQRKMGQKSDRRVKEEKSGLLEKKLGKTIQDKEHKI